MRPFRLHWETQRDQKSREMLSGCLPKTGPKNDIEMGRPKARKVVVSLSKTIVSHEAEVLQNTSKMSSKMS